jgi:predicted dehydrogenase
MAHAGMAVLPFTSGSVFAQNSVAPDAVVRTGLVGCGGRGSWISGLFKSHGGFDFAAVADYFPERAQRTGEQLEVPADKRFSGLEGFKRLVDSGIEAVVLQTPPFFFPGFAETAIAAGLHIYMAKPVAIDIPGTFKIKEVADKAAKAGLVFFADYQLPQDPVNREVFKRIRANALGRLQAVFSSGWAGGNGYQDPPCGETIESRLKDLIWCNDVALGGDYIVHYDVHIIDAVVRALGRKPVGAMGGSAAFRPSVHGDALDSSMVTYQFEDGMLWMHQGILGMYHDWIRAGRLTASLQGTQASACLSYAGKSYVRGGNRHFSGGVPNPEQSVRTNIESFHQLIQQKDSSNAEVMLAVDSNLTAILGREAAARRKYIELSELIKEDRALRPDLTGLSL